MENLSYQLYSSRNFPPLADTFVMLKDLGYTAVEGFGGLVADAGSVSEMAALLAQTGLKMPTCHVGLDLLEDTPATAVEIANTLGVQSMFVPHLAEDERPTDADGWRDFGARLDRAGAPLRDAGIGFGWHNHDFEFVPGADTHPLDHILTGGPGLELEFDVAWCVRAGTDPSVVMDRYGDRIVGAHVKDIAPTGECTDEDGWADVGQGTMDWPAIISALTKTNCSHYVMEHDNPSDDRRFAARSIEFVSSI